MTGAGDWEWLRERVGGLRRGDGGTALHKPLLLALAVSKSSRWHRFVDVEGDLADLLARFGDTARPEPHLPFWHLKNDDGIWEVRLTDPDDLVYRSGKRRPTRTSLRQSHATAGLGSRVWGIVEHDRDRALKVITSAYFDETTAEEILGRLGHS